MTTIVERRRIALIGHGVRVDLALPLDGTLADAVASSGLHPGSGRFSVLGPGGFDVPVETVSVDLIDGGLYAIVDRSASESVRGRRGRRLTESTRIDHGSRWWLLAALALALMSALANGPIDPTLRLVIGSGIVLLAVVVAACWARDYSEVDAPGFLATLAPIALAFAAGFALVPTFVVGGPHLAVAAGLLVSAIMMSVIAVFTRNPVVRAAAGTASILLVTFSAVWGITLLMHWESAQAAVVSVGLVPLILRALPSTLVNFPEGYFINYAHFMTSRWSVRGVVPTSPGEFRTARVRGIVAASSGRLVVGTILVAVAAAVMAPLALTRLPSGDPFVMTGGIILMVSLLLSLLLTPRHTPSRVLRWIPRGAAACVLLALTIAVGPSLAIDMTTLGALALIVAALIAVSLTVPLSRGARSLGWSRAGDFFEWLAVALALPGALLCADILTFLRGMMAG